MYCRRHTPRANATPRRFNVPDTEHAPAYDMAVWVPVPVPGPPTGVAVHQRVQQGTLLPLEPELRSALALLCARDDGALLDP